MQVQPYLFFEGRCEEAIEFYRKALGAEVTMLMRYKDSPEPDMCPPGAEDKVMHAAFRIGDTGDGFRRHVQGQPDFQGFSLSLTMRPTKPRRSACSRPCPTAARCRCPWPRPSSRRASAWSPTASASCG